MKWEMAENSVFAVLLRSPWWVSIAVAGGVYMLAKFLLGKFSTLPEIYALFVPLPFAVIGVYAGWQQLRADARVARMLGRCARCSGGVLRRHRAGTSARATVTRVAGAQAELEKAGRRSLPRVLALPHRRRAAARRAPRPRRAMRTSACLRGRGHRQRAPSPRKGIRLVHAELPSCCRAPGARRNSL
jgi:restriction system protein